MFVSSDLFFSPCQYCKISNFLIYIFLYTLIPGKWPLALEIRKCKDKCIRRLCLKETQKENPCLQIPSPELNEGCLVLLILLSDNFYILRGRMLAWNLQFLIKRLNLGWRLSPSLMNYKVFEKLPNTSFSHLQSRAIISAYFI